MPSALYDDKVWLDEQRKFQGIAGEILVAGRSGRNVLALTHFEETLNALETVLRSSAIGFRPFSMFDGSELCQSDGSVWVGLSRDFSAHRVASGKQEQLVQLVILVAEHYPMRSNDAAIVEALDALPCKAQICFHSSLADPLLARFGAGSVTDLFKRLGLDESGYISHTLLSASIRSAQERVAKQVRDEVRTRSAAEWFIYNLPDAAS